MYFEIVKASGGFRARIKGGNNEIMFETEVYNSKSSAEHAIDVVQKNAATARVDDDT